MLPAAGNPDPPGQHLRRSGGAPAGAMTCSIDTCHPSQGPDGPSCVFGQLGANHLVALGVLVVVLQL